MYLPTYLIGSLLHIPEGILVSIYDDKLVPVEVHRGAHVQVLCLVVLRQVRTVQGLVWLLYSPALQELTPDYTCTIDKRENIFIGGENLNQYLNI